jgi:hypothetical protein
MEVKKLYVLAAQAHAEAKGSVSGMTLDPGATRFVLEPWRGAEALHHYISAVRYVYEGNLDAAWAPACHLKSFIDVLGADRVHGLVALVGVGVGAWKVAADSWWRMGDGYAELGRRVFARWDGEGGRREGGVEGRSGGCDGCGMKSGGEFCGLCHAVL